MITIKIVANKPLEESDLCGDITRYIGKTYEVEDDDCYSDGTISVDLDNDGCAYDVYRGEYEVLSESKDNKNLAVEEVRDIMGKYNLTIEDLI